MLNKELFDRDPRDFALELVSDGLTSADHLLMCALKYMSHDDVRDMLDSNELSPRFDEDEEEDEADAEEEINDWLEEWDDGDHDVDAMRIDISNNNLEVGDDARAAEYEHETIVKRSLVNGQFTQAKEQCENYGLDYDELLSEFNANNE